jgi:peroxiredoxin
MFVFRPGGSFLGEIEPATSESVTKRRRAKAVLMALFFGTFAVFSILLKNELRKETSPLAQLPLGHPMPDFTLKDTQGREFTLSKIVAQKKLVLINFWATWCPPCRLEMPDFEKMYEKNSRRGLLIIAVNEDTEPEKLEDYLKQKPVSFPILIDPDGGLVKKLGIQAFPTTLLVAADDKIMAVIEGLDQYMKFRVDQALQTRAVPGGGAGDANVTSATEAGAEEKK